ncbi:MAG TPA: chromate transporter [Tissierellaceae bacterium]|nr:chromate transporter [Tissierellaceae bacterium]
MIKSRHLKLYLSIFRITFSISAFTFGGGYIVIPMMRKYFVNDLELISEQELLNIFYLKFSNKNILFIKKRIFLDPILL